VAIKPLDEFCIRGTEIVRTILDESHTVSPRSLAEFNENREILRRQITLSCPVLWTAAARCSFPLHSRLWTTILNYGKYRPVVWQPAACTKAAAGGRSPRGAVRAAGITLAGWLSYSWPCYRIVRLSGSEESSLFVLSETPIPCREFELSFR
jgi:hypothetical protein